MKNNIFKCFGLSKNDVKNILSDIFADSHGVLITIVEDFADITIKLEADESNCDFDQVSSDIYQRLNNFIYAEEDVSLAEAVFKLLKMNGLTLATAESVTAGNISACFVKNNAGASKILIEGDVVYTEDAKMRLLNVSEKVLSTNSAVSLQTTYDMAKGLLDKSGADIVIATTGYAGGEDNSDNGLNFIAIGDKKKIDVYKNKFEGNRSEVIDIITLASFFYLIKKLRKKDFFLEKNIV